MEFKIACWNIRGMNNEFKQNKAIKFIREERLQICAFIESHLKVMMIEMSKQVMLCRIEACQGRVNFFCSFVYASNSGIERRDLWKKLDKQKQFVGVWPWVIVGDFNVTLNINEHSAGGSNATLDMCEFRDTVNLLEVEDIGSNGFFYTWTKSLKSKDCKTLKKLARILVNEEFLRQIPEAYGMFLPYLVSDHSPVVVIFKEDYPRKGRSFRFSNFITEKDGFLDLVKKEWEDSGMGFHMYRLVQNFKKLKKPLNRMSWSNGNLFEKANRLKDKLRRDPEACDKDPYNGELRKEAAKSLNEYIEAAKDEMNLLQQKVKVQWLKEGDRNTAFFHSMLKAQRNKSKVEMICDELGNSYVGDEVAAQFVAHFENFLGKTDPVEPLLNDIFKNILTNEKAAEMVNLVSDDEIKEAMFDIDSNKASGPDGFTSSFFKKA
uniref:uncharacterized protein LOC122609712 n=1 Tax=Erigeron canadensis TaxID=72917 RepID=UPI001CB8D2F8|nr:uncharacterized protein LOC122609712 [Erigeron canadensis]